MSLASSDPHEDIGVDLPGPRIVFWPMDLLCHGDVVMKAAVDGGLLYISGPSSEFLVTSDVALPLWVIA
jgi:hypothetical protein